METTKEFFKDLGVVALIFVIFFLAMGAIGCGDGTPVYNDQGECIANCGDVDVLVVDGVVNPDDLNGRDTNQPDGEEDDGFVQPDDGKDITQPTDTNRDCGSGPDAHCSDAVDVVETDVVEYNCPYDDSNTPPYPYDELCLPEKAREARCAWNEYTGETHCTGGYNPEQGYIEGCTSHEECQWAPFDEYPPCVCWEACYFPHVFKEWVWYCTPTTELSYDEFFFSSLQFILSFNPQEGETCGVEVDTDYGSYFYTFIPNDQEKKNLLFLKKTEHLGEMFVPAHFLDVASDEITVHRTEGGEVIARCCPDWNC